MRPRSGFDPGGARRRARWRPRSSDAELLEEVGAPGPHDHSQGLLVIGCLFGKRANSAGQGPQHGDRRGGFDVPAGVDPQSGGGLDHRRQLLAAEPLPDRLGGCDDQAEHLPLSVGGGLDRGPAGGQQHRQGLTVPAATRGAESRPRKCLAGGADRVERVGLGAVTSLGAFGAVELDDDLVAALEVPGQAGAVTAGALDRRRAQGSVLVDELHQFGVAIGGGVDGDLLEHAAGTSVDDGRGVGVDVGVDADSDIDHLT